MINTVINLIDDISWKIKILLIYNSVMKVILRLKGIKYGKGTKFYGIAKFKRAKSSMVIIGSNCIFRSKATSNLIGINRPCIISSMGKNSKLIIGNNCGFSGTVIGCFQEIKIGNNVLCGANTLITDGDWHQNDPRAGENRPVIIENNVWIGEGVKILKGVTIGENSVIGAGSVVTKRIPANVVAAGNPCKVIKIIE